VNTVPDTPIEVYVVVDRVEERLAEEGIEQVLLEVSQHLIDR
jgi:hypothetical protein